MEWLVVLEGSLQTAELIAGETLDEDLSADPDDPHRFRLPLPDAEGDAEGDDLPHAAKAAIDRRVQAINSVGKLRWGRSYEGLEVKKIISIDAEGSPTEQVFLEPASAHLQPEQWADLMEQLGHPRPEPPKGYEEVINPLSLPDVTALAQDNAGVYRVLHFIDLMLAGDGEIDWAAAYAALEIIEYDLKRRGVDGQELGWWTNGEVTKFTATANSPEALGISARHGKPTGYTKPPMSSSDASWLIRRAAAYWITVLLEQQP